MNYCGIDLGTTQSLAAQLVEGLEDHVYELRLLKEKDGNVSVPSVVSFLSEHEYIAGKKAEDRLLSAPDSTVELVKVRLGKVKTIQISIPGIGTVNKSPQQITSLLLKHLVETRTSKIRSAVLTVPADFYQASRSATIQSGELSGVNILELIPEPTAAIYYQIWHDYNNNRNDNSFFSQYKAGKNVLVFDFGGGTLDLSIVKVKSINNVIEAETLYIDGDQTLGGNIIDYLFTDIILNYYKDKRPNDQFISDAKEIFDTYLDSYINNSVLRFPKETSNDTKQFVLRTRREAERVKINLSQKMKETVQSTHTDCPPLPITREQFENVVLKHDKLNIREKIRLILKRAAQQNISVDHVLLVGGSSQIPYIRKIILDSFASLGIKENDITFSSDCMHAVAEGAAIHSALISGQSIPPFRKNVCKNIVIRDILLGCQGQQHKAIAKQGTKYPFVKPCEGKVTIPHALSDHIEFALYDHVEDSMGTATDQLISRYDYYLPLYYTGDTITVKLNIDKNGIYKVDAIYDPTGEEVSFETIREFVLNDEDMRKTKLENEKMRDRSVNR